MDVSHAKPSHAMTTACKYAISLEVSSIISSKGPGVSVLEQEEAKAA